MVATNVSKQENEDYSSLHHYCIIILCTNDRKHTTCLSTLSSVCHGHGRSQDFLWGALFLEKVDDLSLVAALKTQAKTTKLTAPTLLIFPAHQKCALKFHFLLWQGVKLPARVVHLQLSPINYAPNFLFSALAVHLHPVHPLATPMVMRAEKRKILCEKALHRQWLPESIR